MMISKQAQSSDANAMMKRVRHPKFASEDDARCGPCRGSDRRRRKVYERD
jgi:hypothetical protein